MNFRIVIFNLFFMTFSLCAQTNYYVSLTGNNSNSGLSESQAWRTITYSASDMSPVKAGDVVFVKAGNYGDEHILVNKSYIRTQPIIFEGYHLVPGDSPVLSYSFGDSLDSNIMPLLDAGKRDQGGTAITLYSQRSIVFRNFQIMNYATAIDGWEGSYNMLDNIIAINLGNSKLSYSGKGFSFSPSGSGVGGDNNFIKNCIIANACAEGISIVGNSNRIQNCKIYCNEDNTVHASMDYYIVLAGDSNHINNCYIERVGDLEHGGAGIGIKEFGQHNLIEDCIAKNLENSGFYVRWANVKNNEFRRCKSIGTLEDVNGFLIRDGASHNVFNACISDHCSSPIRFLVSGEDENYCGRNNTFNNCLITNSKTAVDFNSWAIPGSADSNSFINCLFKHGEYLFNSARQNKSTIMTNCIINEYENLVTGSETLDINFTYCDFFNNSFTTPLGIGNIEKDPLFVDETNMDFHLSPTSPCIDAGTSLDIFNEDIDGQVRPQGQESDIGIYEYNGTLLELKQPSKKLHLILNFNNGRLVIPKELIGESYQIVSLLGNIVKFGTIKSSSLKLDDIKSGVYILQIKHITLSDLANLKFFKA